MTQADVLTILKTGANVFLTGEPGSGKTHTINTYVAWLRSHDCEPAITAATGIAATHIGGMTIHAWSGVGISTVASAAEVDRIAAKEAAARRVRKAQVLIIDEISMLSASVFTLLDLVCREMRRDTRPFGGLTVVLVGDFFQLPPVSRGGENENFTYETASWRELNPIVCYLSEQHRQDDDAYLALLSAIRAGDVTPDQRDALQERLRELRDAPTHAPKLYSHNADVDRVNAHELAKLGGKTHRFTMTSKGKQALVEGLRRSCLSPEVLELKEGARVMFTKNAPQGYGAFVNGTLGTVTSFTTDGTPKVTTAHGVVTASPLTWQVEEYGKVLASVTQVPLRLAYAITVHKSQGMSMDAAVIDLSRAFEYGQGYVALSRVRNLAGLHLLGLNDHALLVHPGVRAQDATFTEASRASRDAFAALSRGELTQLHQNFVQALQKRSSHED